MVSHGAIVPRLPSTRKPATSTPSCGSARSPRSKPRGAARRPGQKFEHYRTIPTLREYVLVSHRERRIEVRRRGPDGTWSERRAGRGEMMEFDSLGIELTVDELYDRSPLTRAL